MSLDYQKHLAVMGEVGQERLRQARLETGVPRLLWIGDNDEVLRRRCIETAVAMIAQAEALTK